MGDFKSNFLVKKARKNKMRIAILSTQATLYSTRKLVEAGEKRGHEVQVIDYLRCYMSITSMKTKVIYRGESLEGFDAIIPRIGSNQTFYGAAVVRQFEMMGVFTANPSQAISRSRDKLYCLQLLAREGIGLPVTGCAHSTKDIDGLINTIGGAPLVIKLLEGTQGIGVVLAETYQAAKSVIEAFIGLNSNILAQEFIEEADGADLRCFVVGDRVIAAIKRQGAEGEFRSNLHRGGKAKKIKLSPQERSTAMRSAKAIGLKVAGVDLLRSHHGPVVIEVNSSPGLEGIETTTGVNISGKIIEFLEKNAGKG